MKNYRLPPHEQVYTRLQPSIVHEGGVGVFAIRAIKRGAHLFPGDEYDKLVWVDRNDVEKAPKPIRRLYHDFAVLKRGKYGSPKNFNRMTVAWYLNEPRAGEAPNVWCDPKTYQFYAARDIKPGEELTVDYSTYSESPQPAQLRKRRPSRRLAA